MSFRALSSTQPTSSRVVSRAVSRASSRSTIVPPSDKEIPDHLPATTGRTRRSTTEDEETNVGPIRQSFKRPRDPETQDESDPPLKRIRLRHSSTRMVRAVTSRFVTFSLILPHYHRPIHNPRLSLRKLSPPQHHRTHLSSRTGDTHYNQKELKTKR